MIISSVEELVEGAGIVGVNFSIVDEVFAGVFGIIRSRVFWQTPNQPQNGSVRSQRFVHFLFQ